MPDSADFQMPPEQERLSEILTKILGYQHSLPDGRAVELDELLREGVLSPLDEEFLTSHSVTPPDDLLLHIEFTERDGLGVSPGFISFGFQSAEWRERLPAIRSIAAEFGLRPWQDEVVQSSHTLSFNISADAAQTAAATVALLSRGCGLSDETEITYAAGALDEA